ncbi:MAG: hypothetical protein WAW17_06360 [Rhodococcus sp. (in: high G+C Gram-positive bacteria)]|uniref:hypothetical protein n=1 Tax=Rhodococcus sp. TaxID=1831 RepID=UPI003BB1EBAA
MENTIVEDGRARAPAGTVTGKGMIVGGQVALGGASLVILGFSLAFACTLDNGNQPWMWPARYSAAWFVVATIMVTTLWTALVTLIALFASRPHRGIGTATFVVAAVLAVAAVAGLFRSSDSSAMQLWLICAMNLAYQATYVRSG